MRFMAVRLTVRRLMVWVALLALASALIRLYPALAALAASVFSLALIRTWEKIDRSRSAGRSMRAMEIVASCLYSLVVAVTILGASFFPALGMLSTLSAWRRGPGLDDALIMYIMLSALLGMLIAYLLRRIMW
jgi:hypothetical protein